MANVPPDTAWNTAASFVTNTNWQNYAGEATMGYLSQMAGLMVQQFMSAAVGLPVGLGPGEPADHRDRDRQADRDRDDPRVHPVQDRPARQLLGGPDPRDHPAAAADRGHRH